MKGMLMCQKNTNKFIPGQPNGYPDNHKNCKESIIDNEQIERNEENIVAGLNTDLCFRVFESYIVDLKIAVKQYYSNCLDAESFVKEIKRIYDCLNNFRPTGNANKILNRASMVIMDKVFGALETTKLD